MCFHPQVCGHIGPIFSSVAVVFRNRKVAVPSASGSSSHSACWVGVCNKLIAWKYWWSPQVCEPTQTGNGNDIHGTEIIRTLYNVTVHWEYNVYISCQCRIVWDEKYVIGCILKDCFYQSRQQGLFTVHHVKGHFVTHIMFWVTPAFPNMAMEGNASYCPLALVKWQYIFTSLGDEERWQLLASTWRKMNFSCHALVVFWLAGLYQWNDWFTHVSDDIITRQAMGGTMSMCVLRGNPSVGFALNVWQMSLWVFGRAKNALVFAGSKYTHDTWKLGPLSLTETMLWLLCHSCWWIYRFTSWLLLTKGH